MRNNPTQLILSLTTALILSSMTTLATAATCPEPSSLKLHGHTWYAPHTDFVETKDNSFQTPIKPKQHTAQPPKVSISFLGAFWWGKKSPISCIYDIDDEYGFWAAPITLTNNKPVTMSMKHLAKGWNCGKELGTGLSCSCFAYGKTKDCAY